MVRGFLALLPRFFCFHSHTQPSISWRDECWGVHPSPFMILRGVEDSTVA
jgi:hypothetical protein